MPLPAVMLSGSHLFVPFDPAALSQMTDYVRLESAHITESLPASLASSVVFADGFIGAANGSSPETIVTVCSADTLRTSHELSPAPFVVWAKFLEGGYNLDYSPSDYHAFLGGGKIAPAITAYPAGVTSPEAQAAFVSTGLTRVTTHISPERQALLMRFAVCLRLIDELPSEDKNDPRAMWNVESNRSVSAMLKSLHLVPMLARLLDVVAPVTVGGVRIVPVSPCVTSAFRTFFRMFGVDSTNGTYEGSVTVPAGIDGPLARQMAIALNAEYSAILAQYEAHISHYTTLYVGVPVTAPAKPCVPWEQELISPNRVAVSNYAMTKKLSCWDLLFSRVLSYRDLLNTGLGYEDPDPTTQRRIYYFPAPSKAAGRYNTPVLSEKRSGYEFWEPDGLSAPTNGMDTFLIPAHYVVYGSDANARMMFGALTPELAKQGKEAGYLRASVDTLAAKSSQAKSVMPSERVSVSFLVVKNWVPDPIDASHVLRRPGVRTIDDAAVLERYVNLKVLHYKGGGVVIFSQTFTFEQTAHGALATLPMATERPKFSYTV